MIYPYIKCYAKANDEEKLIGMRFLKETKQEAKQKIHIRKYIQIMN